MLRVTTLYASSAIATARYYTRYLAGTPGEEPGVWCGDQAIGLGLSGRVSADSPGPCSKAVTQHPGRRSATCSSIAP